MFADSFQAKRVQSGWSRSAAVGPAVWGSTKMDRSRSEPSTAPGSPADSDNEESEADVDYDDVSFLPYLHPDS